MPAGLDIARRAELYSGEGVRASGRVAKSPGAHPSCSPEADAVSGLPATPRSIRSGVHKIGFATQSKSSHYRADLPERECPAILFRRFLRSSVIAMGGNTNATGARSRRQTA